MDAVVVHPNSRGSVYQSLGGNLAALEPPLWARLITGYLLDNNCNVTLLDTDALELTHDESASRIVDCAPRLVIVVVYGHQPSASTQSMVAAEALCKSIKNLDPNLKILIVGGHVAALPEQTLREESVDFVCSGEGPVTSLRLLEALENKFPMNEVPNLVWKDEFSQLRRNLNTSMISDLDKELHGNVWHLLPMEKYRSHNWQCFGELESRQPYASIYTTLGCPYQCVFCCINAPFPTRKYRCRSPEVVVEEIDMLYHKYAVKTFKITDEMFVLKKNHYLKICSLLAEKPYAAELNIWAYARIDTVDEDTLLLLRKAGIKWLALGIESADESVRDGANKTLQAADIINIVKNIQAADINVIGNFIFGLPADTEETMQKTLDLAQDLNCEFVNFYSAMAYPGSQLYTDSLANNKDLPATWSGYSQHSYDCQPLATDNVSSANILAFRDDAFHQYFNSPNYLSFIESKFGIDTRKHIIEMSKTRLNRKLLKS